MKLELISKYNIGDLNSSFVHSSITLDKETLIILTSDKDDIYQYSLIILCNDKVKKISLNKNIIGSGRDNYPILIKVMQGFGIITKTSELYYYASVEDVPQIITLNDSVLPKSAQMRFGNNNSNTNLLPVLFEDKFYCNDARYYALLDLKNTSWEGFYHLNSKDFQFHRNQDDPPKIDTLKIYDNDFYAFSSGGKTTSVNKWGMDYYSLIKITKNGSVIESFIESENLQESQTKKGINAKFTNSEYVILEQRFKNDTWKGKQKLFSLETKNYITPSLPKGFSKYKIEQIDNKYIWVYNHERFNIKNIIRLKIIEKNGSGTSPELLGNIK